MKAYRKTLFALLCALFLAAPVGATQVATNPNFLVIDDDELCTGCEIYTYECGGVTPLTTYQDRDLTTPHAWPIETTDGLPPALIYFSSAGMRTIVRDPDGVTIFDRECYEGQGSSILSFKLLSKYPATGNGRFANAVTDIGATSTLLWIDTDDTLGGNVTSPATLTVAHVPGNTLDKNGNVLTINGPILAGENQLFEDGATLGALARSQGVRVSWFGFNSSNSAADNATALEHVDDAIGSGGAIVHFPVGDFDSDPVSWDSLVILKGAGKYGTTEITYDGVGVNWTMNAARSEIHDINFVGVADQGTGLLINGVRDTVFEGIRVEDFDKGIDLYTSAAGGTNGKFNIFRDMSVLNCNTGMILRDDGLGGDTPHNTRIYSSRFQGNDDYGLKLEDGNEVRMYGVDWAGGGGTELYINISNVKCFGCSFETDAPAVTYDIQAGVQHTKFYGLIEQGTANGTGNDNDNYLWLESNRQRVVVGANLYMLVYSQVRCEHDDEDESCVYSEVTGEANDRYHDKAKGYRQIGNGTDARDVVVMDRYELTTAGGAGATAIWTKALADESHLHAEARVTAKQSNTSGTAIYHVEAGAYRNGGVATLTGAAQDLITPQETDGAWACQFNVDGANNLELYVTGDSVQDTDWVAVIDWTYIQ
jgi:hypothetical protein